MTGGRQLSEALQKLQQARPLSGSLPQHSEPHRIPAQPAPLLPGHPLLQVSPSECVSVSRAWNTEALQHVADGATQRLHFSLACFHTAASMAAVVRATLKMCAQASAVEHASAELGGLDISQAAAAPLHQPAVSGPVLHDLHAALRACRSLLLHGHAHAHAALPLARLSLLLLQLLPKAES